MELASKNLNIINVYCPSSSLSVIDVPLNTKLCKISGYTLGNCPNINYNLFENTEENQLLRFLGDNFLLQIIIHYPMMGDNILDLLILSHLNL